MAPSPAAVWYRLPHLIAIFVLSALSGPALPVRASAQTAAQDAPTVPNFWDPRASTERPPAGSVTTIRFITTSDFPPFNFIDSSGRLTGFNVDLARAICKQLSATCTMQARPWSDLVNALGDGRADAAIAGIAMTEETRQRLAFSDVYLRSPARFAIRRNTSLTISPAGLRGHTVGVVEKSAQEAYLAAFFPEAQRRTFPDADTAHAALKDGSIEAVFDDGIRISFWLQGKLAEDCCVFAGGPYLDSRYFGNGYSIAFSPKAAQIRQAINAALEDLHDSGAYAELYLRYFPVSFY